MRDSEKELVRRAKEAAVDVLLHNDKGDFFGLPRTAGWGYPEPYTRDLMLSSLGVLATGNETLRDSFRRVLITLAEHQTPLGHMPGLVHDPEDLGASDTTPLFLLGLAFYRKAVSEDNFLEEAAEKALTWMMYQSPDDRVFVAQQPTSDWRDEQWVPGYGLYVNALVYIFLRAYGQNERAEELKRLINGFIVTTPWRPPHVHEGLNIRGRPYYAFWSYKVHNSDRFDLVGNSLAILSGIASPYRARSMVNWIERECDALRRKHLLASPLPPVFFPYITQGDLDWKPRYEIYNRPGDYHNGGVWPFACGLYVAATVAAGFYRRAETQLVALTELVRGSRRGDLEFGFNEWIKAQTGAPSGQDWQTWSAAMYLYAAECVEKRSTPFLDEIRNAGR
jgi:Alkaline and neutral invertase